MLQSERVERKTMTSRSSGDRTKGLEAGSDGQFGRPLLQPKAERAERAKAWGRRLGWFSVGLGAAQLAMPGALSKLLLGHDDPMKRRILRGLGIRELAVGLGLLTRPSGVNWMFGRVAGDLMDLALLGWSAGTRKANVTNVSLSAAAVAGVTVLDFQVGRAMKRTTSTAPGPYDVSKSIIVSCTPEAAYRYWRDLRNVPRFMKAITSVETIDDHRSHWSVRGPAGIDLSWDAEITDEGPNEHIGWRTLPGAPLPSAGEVRFVSLSNERGTEVRVRMAYDESSRMVLRSLGKIFAKGLEFQVGQDLRHFKQLMEVGEIVQSDASIHTGPHPARPTARGGLR